MKSILLLLFSIALFSGCSLFRSESYKADKEVSAYVKASQSIVLGDNISWIIGVASIAPKDYKQKLYPIEKYIGGDNLTERELKNVNSCQESLKNSEWGVMNLAYGDKVNAICKQLYEDKKSNVLLALENAKNGNNRDLMLQYYDVSFYLVKQYQQLSYPNRLNSEPRLALIYFDGEARKNLEYRLDSIDLAEALKSQEEVKNVFTSNLKVINSNLLTFLQTDSANYEHDETLINAVIDVCVEDKFRGTLLSNILNYHVEFVRNEIAFKERYREYCECTVRGFSHKFPSQVLEDYITYSKVAGLWLSQFINADQYYLTKTPLGVKSLPKDMHLNVTVAGCSKGALCNYVNIKGFRAVEKDPKRYLDLMTYQRVIVAEPVDKCAIQ